MKQRQPKSSNAPLSPEEKERIDKFYNEAPPGYVIAHIIPLEHALVCGLHVLANLRYVTPEEKKAKGNRFIPYAYRVINGR
jgi:hypothetical protein